MFHNLCSVLIPSLASCFFPLHSYLEGPSCTSSHCVLIEQVEASGHTSVYEMSGQ